MIACLPETMQEGFYGKVSYDQDESEGEEKKAKLEVKVNVVLPTRRRGW